LRKGYNLEHKVLKTYLNVLKEIISGEFEKQKLILDNKLSNHDSSFQAGG
jgi:hypothetical protein